MMKQPCFGKLYSAKAKECQICRHSVSCWDVFSETPRRFVSTSGYTIAIMTIIKEGKEVTVGQIKARMEERFKGKELNIYYYLGVLKKQGLVDVTIKGRQRLYSLR